MPRRSRGPRRGSRTGATDRGAAGRGSRRSVDVPSSARPAPRTRRRSGRPPRGRWHGCRRVEIDRRVRGDEVGVCGLAARDVAQPGAVVGTGDRRQLVGEVCPLPFERRPDVVPDRSSDRRGEPVPFRARPAGRIGGRRPGQRPRVIGPRQEVVELGDDAVDQRPRRDEPVPCRARRPATWRSIHGPISRQRASRASPSSTVAERLEAGDVQERDLGAVERVDRPPGDATLHDAQLELERVDERVARHPLGRRHAARAGSAASGPAARPDAGARDRSRRAGAFRIVEGIQPGIAVLLITGYTGASKDVGKYTRLDKPFGRREIRAAFAELFAHSHNVLPFPNGGRSADGQQP